MLPINNKSNNNEDELIMDTANDALYSKASAVNCNYFQDNYLKYFLKIKRNMRKSPIINRGTFLRVNTIDTYLMEFLNQFKDEYKQIVSLGAGYDTRYFYLKEKSNFNNLKYFEIDFKEIINTKSKIILNQTELNQHLTDIHLDNNSELNSKDYCLISGDLKNFNNIVDQLKKFDFNPKLPTFFISECVLIYLDPIHSDEIIDWISKECPQSMIVTYEQILPNDDFGQMMLQNLKLRGIELKGIHQYPTLQSQIQRYQLKGFQQVECINLLQSEKQLLSQEQINELNRLERLDEIEEWELICNHYCFAIAKTY